MKPTPTWNIDDSTKLNCFQVCPRKYFYEYVLGWRIDRPSVHLVFGGAIHEALDVLLTGLKNHKDITKPETLDASYEAFMEHYRRYFDETYDSGNSPKDPYGALQLLTGWAAKHKHAEFEVLYVEVPGNVPVGDQEQSWQLYFKIDTIIKAKEGICCYEHKTTGQNSSAWRDSFALSLQVGTYLHVLYSLFPENEVYGALIDGLVIKKSGVEFETIPVRRTYEHMSVWDFQVRSLLAAIDFNFQLLSESTPDTPAMGCFPLNTESCTKYGTCTYHSMCMSWPNPLKSIHRRPMNLGVEHWDPRGTVINPKQYVDGTAMKMVEVQPKENT